MIVVVLGLFISIAIEFWDAGHDCVLTSISAYYYTPVHNYFVAALMSVGVCLFCLKGSTVPENTLLNLAGMLAPIVALVPTKIDRSCVSVVASVENPAAIENNVIALLAVGAIGLLILARYAKRSFRKTSERVGYGAAVAVWLVTALVFIVDQRFFRVHAHYWAAVPMFLLIVVVVWINAKAYKPAPARSPRNPYTAVAAAMLVTVVAAFLLWLFGWDYWTILVEGLLIGLFGAFWVIQTVELRDEGLREPDAAAT